jgi:ribosomal protein S18 acetylase RimI-like enzyme
MIDIEVFDEKKLPDEKVKDEIIDFLFTHLEQYGDPKLQIRKCLDYALQVSDSFGGYALTGRIDGELVGAVIVNKTGMGGYIPENILVYIATHNKHRGKGIGKELMKKTLDLAEGDVKLHVEHDNPARFLYEKFGFTNKYLEMRYKKN